MKLRQAKKVMKNHNRCEEVAANERLNGRCVVCYGDEANERWLRALGQVRLWKTTCYIMVLMVTIVVVGLVIG
jgi:t-SNARE complex subunit (syntaxin)